VTHGDRTLARRAWRRRRLHAQLDRRPVRAPVVEVGPRGTMVPVGARRATLATGHGGRRQPTTREDEALLPATTSSAVGPGDEDGAADAATLVVPEEADPGGAAVAVAAPADGHPLEGLRAHAAAPGLVAGVAFLGTVGLSHDQISMRSRDDVAMIRVPCRGLRFAARTVPESGSIGCDSKSTRTARLPYARSGRHTGPSAAVRQSARQPWCAEQERGKRTAR